jgi:hypothetical protein
VYFYAGRSTGGVLGPGEEHDDRLVLGHLLDLLLEGLEAFDLVLLEGHLPATLPRSEV